MSEANVKATSFDSLKELRALNSANLDSLDFSDFIDKWGVEGLNELYPKHAKFGKHDPPPSYLTSGARVRQWRKLGRGDQEYAIERDSRQEGQELVTPTPALPGSRRSSRRRKREGGGDPGATRPSGDVQHLSQLTTDAATPLGDDAAHQAKKQRVRQEQPSSDATADASLEGQPDPSSTAASPMAKVVDAETVLARDDPLQGWDDPLQVLDDANGNGDVLLPELLDQREGAGRWTTFPLAIPLGPLGVIVRASRSGMCYVHSKSPTAETTLLQVNDYIISIDGVDLVDVEVQGTTGVAAWARLFKMYAHREKHLVVQRRLEDAATAEDAAVSAAATGSSLGSPVGRPSTTRRSPPPTRQEKGDGSDEESQEEMDADSVGPEGPKLQEVADESDGESEDESDDDSVDLRSFFCQGVTVQTIESSTIRDKEKANAGFYHLVGDAYRVKGHYISNNQKWDFDDDVGGFLIDKRAREDEYLQYSWVCLETGESQWAFRRHNCDNIPDPDTGMCRTCWANRLNMFNMCKSEVDARANAERGETIGVRHDQMRFRSPSIVMPRVATMGKQIKVLRNRIYRLEDVRDMLRNKRDQLEVSNLDEKKLFDPGELKRLYQDLCDKETVTEKEIFDYLFAECMAVGQRKKAQGSAKGHRYSGLIIQFAIMLRARCSESLYDFFRLVFNLPTNGTLCEYANADSTSPDGLMMETITQVAEMFVNMGIPRGDWRRYVNLAWDSHVIKDLLAFCPHSQRLVGYAADAFDMDVIAQQFKKRYASSTAQSAKEDSGEREDEGDGAAAEGESTETNIVATKAEDEKKIALGKHFMVFMAQTWTTKSRPFCFQVARYNLASLTGRWVRCNKRQITSALAFAGFIVNYNGFDGASENRSALNQDLTLDLRQLLPELFEALPPCPRTLKPNPYLKVEPREGNAAGHHGGVDERAEQPSGEGGGEQDERVERPAREGDAEQNERSDRRAGDGDGERHGGVAKPESRGRPAAALAGQRRPAEPTWAASDEELCKACDKALANHRRHPDSVARPRKRYKADELPWDMKVAYPHPTVDGVNIVAGADFPHGVKKKVNASDLSGKQNHDRDLHLDGLPVQLRMGYDAWKQCPDYHKEKGVRQFPNLDLDVYLKTSKSCMRSKLAFRAFGKSMKRCIVEYGPKNRFASAPSTYKRGTTEYTAPSTYDSYIKVCEQTDRFVDVMNANIKKGCSSIDSPNHPHVYELLDYVKFLTQWKAQADEANNANLYFPYSTHQDCCWSALSIVIMARTQLPAGHDILQKNGGSDHLEKLFCVSRHKNPNATALGTQQQVAGTSSNMMLDLMKSKKGNTGGKKTTTYRKGEIDHTTVKRRRSGKRNRH